MDNGKPLANVTNLCVSFGKQPILRKVSLRIQPGQIVALVGPNGAGKTTLIKSLFGETPLTDGTVDILGLDPFAPADAQRLWSVARYVDDKPVLYEELKVAEYLRFCARAYAVPERSVEPTVRGIMMNLELLNQQHQQIRTLSFGNQRKVHIASGFFSGENGPRLLVMDEPTVGLDPEARFAFFEIVRHFVNPAGLRSERSVLISSHNLDELSTIADHVIIIHEGQILAAGSIRELAAQRLENLQYEFVLFDQQAEQFAEAVEQTFQVATRVVDERTVIVECPEEATVAQLVQYLGRQDTPFRLREMREQFSSIQRVFFDAVHQGASA